MINKLQMKQIASYLDMDTWNKFRQYSIDNDTSMAKLIVKLVKGLLEKQDKQEKKGNKK